MTTELTASLINSRGWTFYPSHDTKSPQGFNDVAVPECWEHEKYGIVWNINEVLSLINDEIELEIERDLE